MATVEEIRTVTVEEYEYMPGTFNVIKRRTVTETRTTSTTRGAPQVHTHVHPRSPYGDEQPGIGV